MIEAEVPKRNGKKAESFPGIDGVLGHHCMKLPDMFLDFYFDDEGSLKGLPRNDVAMELLQGFTNVRTDGVDNVDLQLMGHVLLKKRSLDEAGDDPVYSNLGPQDPPMVALAQIRAERGLQKACPLQRLESPGYPQTLKIRQILDKIANPSKIDSKSNPSELMKTEKFDKIS